MKIIIPISVGELLDKISILQIKSQYTDNVYVTRELKVLLRLQKRMKSMMMTISINSWMLINYFGKLKMT